VEGKKICVEMIEQIKEIEVAAGKHIMAYRQEELVAEIVEEVRLLLRPGANVCAKQIAKGSICNGALVTRG